MPYLVKTPNALKPLANDLLWSLDHCENKMFLTFDDGPTPDITHQILDILDQYHAKATFFCIGGNVKSNLDVYSEILARGHKTGNHTWNHMNGWEYSDYSYFRNVIECAELVDSNLFRPPYGRIKPSQVRGLKHKYKIVMWDVLSGDWETELAPEQCLLNVTKHAKSGSIVVFHDSEKSKNNMLFALPKVLKHFTDKGFSFDVLPH